MANPQLFQSSRGPAVAPTTTVNRAGGKAYELGPKAALAQYACTGCFGAVYYASAEEQFDEVLKLAAQCEPAFIGQCAVYARKRGLMKDMPAFLLAHLASRKDAESMTALRGAWPQVIDNGKMLRNFVQIVRSGVTGRKSFGSAVKRLIRGWLEQRYADGLFRDNVGEKPSIADVIKMVHPKPADDARRALYGYLLGKEHKAEHLSETVQAYERYKADKTGEVPDVPFQMLDSLGLGKAEWTAIARRAQWQMTRMNLNTFKRHGVLDDPKMVKLLAARLRDPEQVTKARAFPYQLMMAYTAATDIPHELTEALQDAMDHAVANVPDFGVSVVVCPDVSGSMSSTHVTGARKGSTTKVRCIDVAALISAAVLRKNKRARVLPFEAEVVPMRINPRDSVMTISAQIAAIGGGGTNCSAPLALLNKEAAHADLVIYVSDNESWVDSGSAYYNRGTGLAHEWSAFKARNPRAKLVCVDLSPNATAQATNSVDRLNVGGFSDAVFDVIASFVAGGSADHWVDVIEKAVQ